MKFTNGFWQTRPGVDALYAKAAYDIWPKGNGLVITAPTKVIERRGDTLNRPTLTVTLSSPLPDIIGVRVEHHSGGGDALGFDLPGAEDGHGVIEQSENASSLTSGGLTATVKDGAPWSLTFSGGERINQRRPNRVAQTIS